MVFLSKTFNFIKNINNLYENSGGGNKSCSLCNFFTNNASYTKPKNMKRKFFITTALLFCLVACFAFAIVADLTGKWTGILKTPDGNEFPLNYTFKADGNQLTGMASSPNGDVPFTDGKINGSDFSFTLSFNGTDIKNTGKFYPQADSVGMDIDFNGTKMHTTLKRSVDK